MSLFVRSTCHQLSTIFQDISISEIRNIQAKIGILENNKDDSYYPNRGDTKIMRQEIISSIVTLGQWIEANPDVKENLKESSLFIANGCFLEDSNKHFSRMKKVFEKTTKLTDRIEQAKLLFKNIPPLTALETLTNSNMSFVAQYLDIHGNNTTFGNTSYAGFSALQSAANDLKHSNSPYALIGGANGSGSYSTLNNIHLFPEATNWKESAAVAYVLLSNEKKNASSKITHYELKTFTPSLKRVFSTKQFEEVISQLKNIDQVIFSGAFCDYQQEKLLKIVESYQVPHYSFYETYGNIGASSIPMGIVQGDTWIQSGKANRILIVDLDSYGRLTTIQIEKV